MKVIILAGGEGKRLRSEAYNLPKTLRKANGRSLIRHILDNLDFVPPQDICIVVRFMGEKVQEELGPAYAYAWQDVHKGTGHALMCGADFVKDYDGDVLVLYGDMPMIKRETYEAMIRSHAASNASCTILSAVTEQESDFGRVIRDAGGQYVEVVEARDCTAEQLAVKEVNVGPNIYRAQDMLKHLPSLRADNSQNEYYLTDLPAIMRRSGLAVNVHTITDENEILGVNTMEDLEKCERILKTRK